MKFLTKLALTVSFVLGTSACNGVESNLDADESFLGQSEAALSVTTGTLRLGTWNLKRLGQNDKRLDLAAQVIESTFDVVALQEVMTPAGVDDLLSYLPGWSATISDRAAGTELYQEYYAVLTRNGAATVTSSSMAHDDANEWMREPMIACLNAGNTDFCIVNTHVVYGDVVGPRDAEIRALSNLVSRLRVETPSESDYIVLGDFNRSGKAKSFDSFETEGFRMSDDGLTRTTLSSTSWSSPYDHIIFDDVYTGEWTGVAERIDTVTIVCDGSFAFCSGNVSDHAPLRIDLTTAGNDDD